jgi:hypothetical protein
MFDRYTIHRSSENKYVNVKHTEQRAPTDESIKLLNEFQEKALDNLVSQGRIENNSLHVEWSIYSQPYRGFQYYIAIRIKLNGTEHIIKFEVDKPRPEERADFLVNIRNKIAERMATEILLESFNDVEIRDTLLRIERG